MASLLLLVFSCQTLVLPNVSSVLNVTLLVPAVVICFKLWFLQRFWLLTYFIVILFVYCHIPICMFSGSWFCNGLCLWKISGAKVASSHPDRFRYSRLSILFYCWQSSSPKGDHDWIRNPAKSIKWVISYPFRGVNEYLKWIRKFLVFCCDAGDCRRHWCYNFIFLWTMVCLKNYKRGGCKFARFLCSSMNYSS